jgi:hypothetical protein
MQGSKYGAFLENYNKGNNLMDVAAQNFRERIDVDKRMIISKGDEILQQKFAHIDGILLDKDKSGFDKLTMTGNILADLTKDLMSSTDADVKKSGANVLRSYFDTAKKTSDDQLRTIALQIANTLKSL